MRKTQPAAKADEDFAAATGSQGLYMMMYYSHNLHFGAISASMEGHCAEAKRFAGRLAENLRPALNDMPMVQPFVAMPLRQEVSKSNNLVAAAFEQGRKLEAEKYKEQLDEFENNARKPAKKVTSRKRIRLKRSSMT